MLPPATPPSLLLTAPPRSPTNPYPNHPATSPPPPQTPPPPCGMPAAVCLKEALCARRKTHSCTAEPSSNVCIVTLGPEWSPGTGGLPGPADLGQSRGEKKKSHPQGRDESLKKPQASNVTGIGKEGVSKRGGWGTLKTRAWKFRERERARARNVSSS